MKHLLLILLVNFLLISCGKNDYIVEYELYSCLIKKASANDINLEKDLNDFEAELIHDGILKSADGKAKVAYFQKIAETGEVPEIAPSELLSRIKRIGLDLPLLNECSSQYQKKDSVNFVQSNYAVKSKKILAELNGVEMNPSNAATALIRHLNATDFDHPFYRAQMLITCATISQTTKSYIRKIPKKL